MKRILFIVSATFLLISCGQKKETNLSHTEENSEMNNDSLQESEGVFALQENENTEAQIFSNDPEKEWLQDLFKCRNGNKFCFYLDQEELVTTKRFYQFMIDSEQIYGATNLAEEEIPLAEIKYKEKWSSVYPLRKDMEPWLFGRAQDDMENIKDVKIEKIGDLKYRVFVDYGESYQTLNEVALVKSNNSYLIDYCKTEYMD